MDENLPNANENFKPKSKNTKITIRVLALGLSGVWGILLLPTSKETLDTVIYGHKIELYAITKIIFYYGMIIANSITAATFVNNIKNNDRD
jgi:hypothetical protein